MLTVAGAQMVVSDDVKLNTATILRFIERAAQSDVDLLLTPEGSLSGYTHEFDRNEVEEALDHVTQRAADLGVGLALGTCFYEADELCYNQIRFYDKRGTYLGSHAKILRCGTPTTPSRGEIEFYATHELRTFSFEEWPIAGLICNDLWANPEATPVPDPNLVRVSAQAGARVIFHAVNGGRVARGPGADPELVRSFHEANLRMRAKTSDIYVVTVDNAAPETLRCSSPGGVVAPDGSWMVRSAWRGEDLFIGRLSPRGHRLPA